ncbi:MAG: tRNA (adenosine(37)-N6)-dimethylallyltransferase MiaA [Spirochaetales bacterium]|nr:tRNA (adenosine(37)-N6)-dimethylallyltransferase MiaA [Spirochaetales bacterium]
MSTSSKSNLPVVLLFGPTAAGKTDLLAEAFPDKFEIINADSEQVYRGLDVGTAKPDAALRARLPHHLLDVADPDEQFTVGDFVRAADRLAGEIASRGRVPVVSGGTAYYLKHFAFGLPGAPPSDPEVRAAIKRELAEKGEAALHAELERVDPDGAVKISPRDLYRLTRALEVIRQTGRPLSSFRLGTEFRSGYDFLLIGLSLSRAESLSRVTRRVERMFASGLIDEFRSLVARGYGESSPGMRGIGYRELFLLDTPGHPLPRVKELIVLHTMQYAKRQMTFFRSFPGTNWFHPSERAAVRAAADDFLADLA